MEEPQDRRGLAVNGQVIGLVLTGAALLAFVVQNTEDIRFNWLMVEVTLPLWLALLITAALGAVVGNLAVWVLRRRD